MSITITGIVTNGVVIPNAPLPEGAHVEIHGQSAEQPANGRLDRLERDIHDLKERCNQIQDGQSIIVPITTFDPEPYELCNGMVHVVVQPDDESFVASFFDANINASGNTQVDAVANLKDMMISLFDILEKEKKLGKGPAHQLAVLRGIMRRKG